MCANCASKEAPRSTGQLGWVTPVLLKRLNHIVTVAGPIVDFSDDASVADVWLRR